LLPASTKRQENGDLPIDQRGFGLCLIDPRRG